MSDVRQRRANPRAPQVDAAAASRPAEQEPAGRRRSMSSPRYNVFRAARGSDVEDLLLFREQPRQIAVLSLAAAGFYYYSFSPKAQDWQESTRRGLAASVLLFLVYCFLQTRDGLMVRPHPGVWRVVHGCSVVYLLLLAALAVQDREGAIRALQLVFPEVGDVTRQTTSGNLACEINPQTLYRGVSSIWFLAHVAGWWGKMCMFRDWRVCWVLSIAFELLELALQFIIPDFQECWWDSLLMDLLGANILGMILGRITLWLCQTKEYDWSGKKGKKMGYMRFALRQFTPISWDQYHWEVFSSFSRFAQVFFAVVVCLVTELNAFFLLTSLAIPKESKFNSYRLGLVFLIGIPAAAEYYEFISNPECWRLGQNAWMILSICVFEVLVWLKFSGNGVLFPASPPPVVLFAIVAFVVLFSLWVLLFFTTKTKTPKSGKVVGWSYLDVLFWVSFMPLALLTTQWAF